MCVVADPRDAERWRRVKRHLSRESFLHRYGHHSVSQSSSAPSSLAIATCFRAQLILARFASCIRCLSERFRTHQRSVSPCLKERTGKHSVDRVSLPRCRVGGYEPQRVGLRGVHGQAERSARRRCVMFCSKLMTLVQGASHLHCLCMQTATATLSTFSCRCARRQSSRRRSPAIVSHRTPQPAFFAFEVDS